MLKRGYLDCVSWHCCGLGLFGLAAGSSIFFIIQMVTNWHSWVQLCIGLVCLSVLFGLFLRLQPVVVLAKVASLADASCIQLAVVVLAFLCHFVAPFRMVAILAHSWRVVVFIHMLALRYLLSVFYLATSLALLTRRILSLFLRGLGDSFWEWICLISCFLDSLTLLLLLLLFTLALSTRWGLWLERLFETSGYNIFNLVFQFDRVEINTERRLRAQFHGLRLHYGFLGRVQ